MGFAQCGGGVVVVAGFAFAACKGDLAAVVAQMRGAFGQQNGAIVGVVWFGDEGDQNGGGLMCLVGGGWWVEHALLAGVLQEGGQMGGVHIGGIACGLGFDLNRDKAVRLAVDKSYIKGWP